MEKKGQRKREGEDTFMKTERERRRENRQWKEVERSGDKMRRKIKERGERKIFREDE
jgi:hypothetical protein